MSSPGPRIGDQCPGIPFLHGEFDSIHVAYFMHYHFCRVHLTLRITPVWALGVPNHIWRVGELIETALACREPEPPPRQPRPQPRLRLIRGGKR